MRQLALLAGLAGLLGVPILAAAAPPPGSSQFAPAPSVAQAPAVAAAAPTLTIVNHGGVAVEQAFVVLAGSHSWGSNILLHGPIAPGARRLITFPRDASCQQDIRVVFAGRQAVDHLDTNICTLPVMGVVDPGTPTGQPPQLVRITNLGRAPVVQLLISAHNSRSWGANLLHGQIAPGAAATFRIPVDRTCQYDFRIVYPGNRAEERRNENACRLRGISVAAPAPGAAVIPPVAGGPRHSGGGRRLAVRNAYRVPLRGLFFAPPHSHRWSGNLIAPNAALQPGTTQEFALPPGTACRVDLKFAYDNDWTTYASGFNLCAADAHITLHGGRAGIAMWSGTGFYVSPDGYVLTNNHVVYGCGTVSISRPDAPPIPLKLIGQDPSNDLALLQETGVRTPFVHFRATAQPFRPGSQAVSLGYPLRGVLSSLIVTEGIVSSLVGPRSDRSEFQMQTPIQPGNSGGPVFDGHGLVIGVTRSQEIGRRVQNVNFAVTEQMVVNFLNSFNVTPVFDAPATTVSAADIASRNANRVLPLTCYN